MFKYKKSNTQQIFEKSCNQRTITFFNQASMVKLGLHVVFPTLLLSLLFGVFVFADQIIMQQFIPNDGNNYFQLFAFHFASLDELTNAKILLFGKSNLTQEQLNHDFIYAAVANVAVVSLIIHSLSLFISTGASIFYSRSFVDKSVDQKQLLQTSFWGTVITSLLLTALMLAIQGVVINAILPDPRKVGVDSATSLLNDPDAWTPEQLALINKQGGIMHALGYLQRTLILINKARNATIFSLASNYLWFLSSSIFLVSLINFYVFFLRAEGTNLWITVLGVSANLINIVCDYLLIAIAKIGMIGSGLATLISYLFNILGLIIYTQFLSKNHQTNLGLKNLVGFIIKIRLLFVSFVLGLGTFLRDISLTIANILYIPVWITTVSQTGWAGIINDAGAVSVIPIYNLVFFAIYGVIDGMRPIIAFNYAQKNYQRLKKTFYTAIIISLIYAIMVNILIYIPTYASTTDNQFLNFLGANNVQSRMLILRVLMPSMLLQLPFLSLAVAGLGIFQATGKMWLNIILSVLQGLITFFPVLYTMTAISLQMKSWAVMFYAGFTNIVISSLIIFIFAMIYIYRYMGKKEKFTNAELAVYAFVNSFIKIKNKFQRKKQPLIETIN